MAKASESKRNTRTPAHDRLRGAKRHLEQPGRTKRRLFVSLSQRDAGRVRDDDQRVDVDEDRES